MVFRARPPGEWGRNPHAGQAGRGRKEPLFGERGMRCMGRGRRGPSPLVVAMQRSPLLFLLIACALVVPTTAGDFSPGWESAPLPSAQSGRSLPTATGAGPAPLGQSAGAPRSAPLPFDPLSTMEQQRAIALALSDGSGVLSDRIQAIGAALYTDKQFLALDEWPRLAEVWVYDYAKDRTVQLVVDLGLGAVRSLAILDVVPPLAPAEIQRAGELALSDHHVTQRLADLDVSTEGLAWTARPWGDQGGHAPQCARHRCVLVALLQGDRFVFDPLTLVDLSAGTVAGLLDSDYMWLAEPGAVA